MDVEEGKIIISDDFQEFSCEPLKFTQQRRQSNNVAGHLRKQDHSRFKSVKRVCDQGVIVRQETQQKI